MANKSDNDEKSPMDQPVNQPTGAESTVTERRSNKATTVPVDEYDEPLSSDDELGRHEHFRKRPLYKRPAFLIAALVVLIVVTIVGLRYWLYARSHESTDDAFIDGHIIQISPKISGYIARVVANCLGGYLFNRDLRRFYYLGNAFEGSDRQFTNSR